MAVGRAVYRVDQPARESILDAAPADQFTRQRPPRIIALIKDASYKKPSPCRDEGRGLPSRRVGPPP